MSRIVPQDRLQ
jgi:hypothetical protein